MKMNPQYISAISCFIFLTMFFETVTAQVLIIPSYGLSSSFHESNIWSFSIINQSQSQKNVEIEITLKKSQDQSTIFTVISRNVTLLPGVNNFNNHPPLEIEFNYGTSVTAKQMMVDKYLTSGSFTICISVKEEGFEIGYDCSEFELSNLNALNLVSPFDGETVQTLLPTLVWQSLGFTNVDYRLTVCELNPFNNPEEALFHNEKILDIFTREQVYIYKPSDLPLEFNKRYAWKVEAMENNQIQAISESWDFNTNKVEAISEDDSYRLIYKGFNTGSYLFKDEIKIAYSNSHNYKMLNYEIVDAASKHSITNLPKIILQPGMNKININVRQLEGLKQGAVYYFMIKGNYPSEVYKLKFELK